MPILKCKIIQQVTQRPSIEKHPEMSIFRQGCHVYVTPMEAMVISS